MSSIKNRSDLTQTILKEWLVYDDVTGIFTWAKTNSNGSTRRGREAGYIDKDGYHYIKICAIKFRAHILAWLYITGEHPKGVIDHKDQNKSNNSFTNLRDVTHAENSMNVPNANTSNTGEQGIWYNRKTGKYHAYIIQGGKRVWQKIFDDCAIALVERKEKLISLGFSPNHSKNTKRLSYYD